MKKLMIAAAIVCAAVMSQAAQLKWNATARDAVDANGNLFTEQPAAPLTVVLAYLGNTTDGYSYANAKEVCAGVWDIGVDDPDDGSWSKVSGSYDGKNSANGGSFANGQVYAAMLKDADGLHQLTYADGTLDTALYTVTDYSGTTWAKTFTFAAKNYEVASAVPEPTSGLLLLLGVAGLALRRRRA